MQIEIQAHGFTATEADLYLAIDRTAERAGNTKFAYSWQQTLAGERDFE